MKVSMNCGRSIALRAYTNPSESVLMRMQMRVNAEPRNEARKSKRDHGKNPLRTFFAAADIIKARMK